MSLKQTLKRFGLIRYSSCTPLEMYASSRAYRQFRVSALQLYDSLKTPNAKSIVELHCLVGCTVTVLLEGRSSIISDFVVRGNGGWCGLRKY